MNAPLNALRHHVSGAIERGESVAIVNMPRTMVTEIIGMQRVEIAAFDSFIAAKRYVLDLGVVMLEDDSDYPNCADAFTLDGRILCIQPEGFTLS